MERLNNIKIYKQFLKTGALDRIPKDIIDEHITKHFHRGHTNSIFKTWKDYENCKYKFCYGCDKMIVFNYETDKLYSQVVTNQVIFERSHLALHFVCLCKSCIGFNVRINNHNISIL
jgi:hypothetical protein